MTTSHDSRFAGSLVLTTALISWAGLGQAQDMEGRMARLGRTRGQRRNHDVRAIRSGPAVQTSPQLTQRRTTKSYFSTGWPSPIRTSFDAA